jgi:predicted NBD/HSP70 family sugar kinase
MGTGRDTISIRQHNLRAVLRHLHRHGPTTRVELGRVTGLTRSAVGDLVAELTGRKLVAESEVDASGARGRPSLVVAPREDTARVLGVSIGDDTLRIASLGMGGTATEATEVPHEHIPGDPKPSIDQIVALLERQLAMLPAPPLAVGIAVPGPVRAADGIVALAPRLGWRDLALGEEVGRRVSLGVPIVTGNDSNFSALAEHLRGAGHGHDHLIYLGAGLGAGGGIIVGGRLLVGGPPGYGGEIGHMVTDPGGQPCKCGGHGCWETQIAAEAVLRHAGITAATDRERQAALTELLARADRHERNAVAALTAILPPLAAGIATLLSLFTPERLILAGLFAHVLRHAEAELRAAIAHHRPTLSNPPVDLVPALLGRDARLLGAAEAAIEAFFNALPARAERVREVDRRV